MNVQYTWKTLFRNRGKLVCHLVIKWKWNTFYRTIQIKFMSNTHVSMKCLCLSQGTVAELYRVQEYPASGSCKTASPDKSEFGNCFTEAHEPLEHTLSLCWSHFRVVCLSHCVVDLPSESLRRASWSHHPIIASGDILKGDKVQYSSLNQRNASVPRCYRKLPYA